MLIFWLEMTDLENVRAEMLKLIFLTHFNREIVLHVLLIIRHEEPRREVRGCRSEPSYGGRLFDDKVPRPTCSVVHN